MYYFVETLAVSAIVSSYTAPPKLAIVHVRPTQPTHASFSKLITRSTDPSLLLIPTLIAFSGSGVVFSILLHDLVWAAVCLLFLFFAGIYLSVIRNQRL